MQELAILWVRMLHFTGEFSTVLRCIRKPLQAMGVLRGAKEKRAMKNSFRFQVKAVGCKVNIFRAGIRSQKAMIFFGNVGNSVGNRKLVKQKGAAHNG
jgi:hypothetical protein